MNQAVTITPCFITTAEVAKMTSIPLQSVRRLIRQGILPAYKIHGKYLCDPGEILQVIKATRVGGKTLDVQAEVDIIQSAEAGTH